jgi:hypothetical protein
MPRCAHGTRREQYSGAWSIEACADGERITIDGESTSILAPAGFDCGELRIEYTAIVETDPGDRWTPPYVDCDVTLERAVLFGCDGKGGSGGSDEQEWPLSGEAAAWAWDRWSEEIRERECERN